MGESSSNSFSLCSTDWSPPSPNDIYKQMIRFSNLIVEERSSAYERIPSETKEELIPVYDYFKLPFITNNLVEDKERRHLEKMWINSLYGGSGFSYERTFTKFLNKRKRKSLFIMVEE